MTAKIRSLFGEFPPASPAEWEAKIREDLKGADYEKKLLTDTGEGFRTRPYYTADDLDALHFRHTYPGSFPFVRGNRTSGNGWYARQDIRVSDLRQANEKALDILMKGIDSVGFILDPDKDYTPEDLDRLLKNIFAEIVEINFTVGGNAKMVLENHVGMICRYNRDFQKIYGSIDFDPLLRLALTGRFYSTEETDFRTCCGLIKTTEHLPHFQVINIHGQAFDHAGASVTEALAFSLAAGADYLTRLTEMGHSVNLVAPKIKFTLATGPDYFMEIAKIRAARLLWANIVKAYGPIEDDMARMNIHAVTSMWNMTAYDPYVNMLRSTTESMSSILAGIDSMTVLPYNAATVQEDAAAERIARNQQLLLKEESYLDKVADPAAGSYYIEKLTSSVAEEAWKLFLETDARGGFLEALGQGFIQDRIGQTALQRDADLASRREVLLGVNQFPDFTEKTGGAFDERIFDRVIPECVDMLVRPLPAYRGGAAFEALRYKTDRYALQHKRPSVFLLAFGNQGMRIARAQFARNFFGCGGFEVFEDNGYASAEEGVGPALESRAEIVVFCSADEEYPQLVPGVTGRLKDKAIMVVAGSPKESIDILKNAGIGHFIHIRSNVLEELRAFQEKLGL
jgi:methylmalonyl-CoA mutase